MPASEYSLSPATVSNPLNRPSWWSARIATARPAHLGLYWRTLTATYAGAAFITLACDERVQFFPEVERLIFAEVERLTLLTKDEARRIASNITRAPNLKARFNSYAKVPSTQRI